MLRAISLLGALLLVLVACSPSATEDTTATTQATATTEAAAATTDPPATTTTAPDATTTTGEPLDSNAAVEAKTAAVVGALPEGWTSDVMPAVTDEQNEDLAYEPCLLPDDFDIDNLDDATAAALQVEFEGPTDPSNLFGAPMGGIEARVFNSEAEAEDAFAVFERVWGTPEGLTCMTNSVLSLMGDDIPAGELSVTTEAVTVAGSQAGARFEMSFNIEGFEGGFYVEFQGARMGECTVIASFITFGEPFDRDVADAIFQAAINA